MILILPLLVIAIIGGVGWYASGRAIHPKQNQYGWSLSDYPNLKPDEVTLPTSDGISLAGRFFPGTSRATIILSHGYGDNQDQMIAWADFLNRAGISVFTYDMRGRGQSGGAAVTLGAREQTDLVSVVDYLVTRSDVDPDKIGALGVSLGGSVTILAAAQDTRIKAVVNDSGFSDASNVVSTSFQKFVNIPAFPFAPVTVRIAEWRTGADMNDVRPVAVIGKISPRPIFIIHGLADTLVPPSNSERNLAAAGEPKSDWWVPGAEHVRSMEIAPAEYDRRVVQFFTQSLGL
ncbi:MAG TPA: alpha/beta hydrolase [Nitrolancea sp.]|nr:alpha/beta hydrolase [Nitrolancea sp.]